MSPPTAPGNRGEIDRAPPGHARPRTIAAMTAPETIDQAERPPNAGTGPARSTGPGDAAPTADDPGGLTVSLGDSFRQRLAREGHVTLSDLWDDLLFPRLVKAPGLALRPERLLFGVAALLGLGAALAIASTVTGRAFPNEAVFQSLGLVLPALGQDLARGAWGTAWDGLAVTVAELGRLAVEQPVGTAVFAVVAAAAWALFGVAIARGAACEHAAGVRVGLAASFGFSLRRIASGVGAIVMVPAAGLAALGLVGGLGAVLLAVPGLDLIGAALFGLTALAGLVVAVVGAGWVLGFPVLTQAIPVEDDDAFDAVQRTLGYAAARPLALVVYLALAIAQGFVAVWIVWTLGSLAVDLAAGSIEIFGGRGAVTVRGGEPGFASAIVSVWRAAPLVIAASFAVSYAHCAGMIVYLLMRRIVDGQDPDVVRITPDRA